MVTDQPDLDISNTATPQDISYERLVGLTQLYNLDHFRLNAIIIINHLNLIFTCP